MRTFILAGGFATRLWPLTEKRAKPLLPLAGKPILTHLVERIPVSLPVTVSTNAAFASGFRAWREELHRGNLEVIIEETRSEEEKLGALGALAQWIEQAKIAEDVLLLTGDNYVGFSMDRFLAAYQQGHPLFAAYDIRDRERAKAFGTVVLAPDGKTIEGFEEKPKEPRSTLVSTGCSILPAAALPIVVDHAKRHPDNVGGIFEEFLRRHLRVDCFTFSEPWFDVGSFESYLEATKVLVGSNVFLGEGATLERCRCEGSVVVGAHSTVRDCVLTDTVIFDHSDVTDCVLTECIIDRECTLTRADLTGKMLREGTRLELPPL